MPKDKRRMIDADRLIELLNREALVCREHYRPGIEAATGTVHKFATPKQTTWRNPGWEERAKEHDS